MSLALPQLLPDQSGVPDLTPVHMTLDSRAVAAGDVFVALAGGRHDGHAYAADAARRGAVAVLAERAVEAHGIPVVVVPELRERVGRLAARFYGDPGHDLHCVGVTGTNGKTSIAHYLADLAERVGVPAGYIGTIGWGRPGTLETAALTTPDAVTVQRQLAGLRAAGCTWAVLEVSSHALDQGRVEAVPFRTAVFSNLSRDHLDYHADMEAYGAAKAKLFAWPGLALAVLNRDDAFGRRLAGGLDPAVQCVTYGAGDRAADGGTLGSLGSTGTERMVRDVAWSELVFDRDGARGRWQSPWGACDFRLPLFAEFSVANLTAAVAVLAAHGIPIAGLAAAAASLAQVPGRMERFAAPDRPAVVVDFAHTPDALLQVLRTLRPRVRGRLICVFGCGGDRDPGKRPLMAAAAEQHADVLWLTSDNPRSETPTAIIADMRAGLTGRACVHEEPDRRAAIAAALGRAGPDDLVVIAGKGHEDYQEARGVRVPFSDRALVAELLGAQRR